MVRCDRRRIVHSRCVTPASNPAASGFLAWTHRVSCIRLDVSLDNGPLTLALAMLVGVVAQGVGHHIRIPGIVLLLVAGVGLGPDGADVIRPSAMGSGLPAIVGYAVAIILFEGGLSLRLADLRSQATPIRRLVTTGGLVTAALATFAARAFMDWDWRLSILFGTLVIVTGPTVVTPLVRRLRLSDQLTSILVAEGIFIDAIGATIAVVALEVAIAPSNVAAAAGALSIFLRFGIGAVIGVGGGLLIVLLHRTPRLVPHGLESVLVLAITVAVFHTSDAIIGESGITAAIVAGLVVGNVDLRARAKIAEFNEELTVLLVATLFVLLAADVRLDDVFALGWRGVAVVVALMLVVRPANVFASTFRTTLTLNEKLYLSWIAPRGIVAAAVASLFALELAHDGVSGGVEMRALVFVVIAATVTVQGLTAAVVGNLLKVRKPARSGTLILGGNALARFVAAALRGRGERVVLVERAGDICAVARQAGFDVVEGDGLESSTLEAAGIAGVGRAIGLTPNEHVNFVFARLVGDDYPGPELAIALEQHDGGITPPMLERYDVGLLFGTEHDLLAWLDRSRRHVVELERWRLRGQPQTALEEIPGDLVLPILLTRASSTALFIRGTELRTDDELDFAIAGDEGERARAWLLARGWAAVGVVANAPPPAGA